MKKALLILVLAMVVAGGVFAQTTKKDGLITIGGGLSGVMPINRYELTIGGTTYVGDWNIGFGGGVNVFADFKYAVLDVDLQFIGEKSGVDLGIFGNMENETFSTNLLFSLKGKYPMTLDTEDGYVGVWYPYAGVDYRLGLSGSADGNDIDSSDVGDTFNALSIIVGAGADMPINSTGLVFRMEIGIGYTFPTKWDTDQSGGFDVFKMKMPFKFGVGYTF
ncbi:hypothetical protein FACS189461_4510 [Spirochaetia bacterium]|nr:hypothetical protein FACS189461_4510 [Spirochaetia bacterium]